MPAKNVRVKAKPGRVARTSPTGDFIPEDRFVPVPHTNYVDRLINHHKDLIVEPAKEAAPAPKPAPKADAEASKKESK